MAQVDLEALIEAIDRKKRIDPAGEERIARVLEGKEVPFLPLVFWRPRNTSVPGSTFDIKEQFYDKGKMLYGHLEEILLCAGDAFDAPLCLRPNFGTIFIPAIFGLKYKVYKDTFPWLTSHLTKREIIEFSFPDLDQVEIMRRAVEYIEFFRDRLPPWIHIYLPDTQGPFDIAHLLYGDNLFYELYDDPAFVHRLLELCTQMYIEVTKKLKKILREEYNTCYHGHALPRGIFMKNGGVRVSEDTPTLLSPKQIEEFVLPYVKKALAAFGGGFIHFCGKNEHLLEAFLRIDEVRAINLGNPEMYDFDSTMEKFRKHKKCYFGLWPKKPEESLAEYIRRMKTVTGGGKGGLILHFDETMFPEYTCAYILSKWRGEL